MGVIAYGEEVVVGRCEGLRVRLREFEQSEPVSISCSRKMEELEACYVSKKEISFEHAADATLNFAWICPKDTSQQGLANSSGW